MICHIQRFVNFNDWLLERFLISFAQYYTRHIGISNFNSLKTYYSVFNIYTTFIPTCYTN